MIGETIGNFRLVERLGRGGMGEVYRAEHKDLQTPVAVKLLNDDISENHDRERDHARRQRHVGGIADQRDRRRQRSAHAGLPRDHG